MFYLVFLLALGSVLGPLLFILYVDDLPSSQSLATPRPLRYLI